jgi:DNA-binding transcriptional regulator YhcF (GntR family)
MEQIRNGELAGGARLPSIRDAAEKYGVSVGTVRHVYTILEQEGLIIVDRGRGTFVRNPEQHDQASSKKIALESIDEMLNILSINGFSSQQAQILFELRLRQRESMTRPVRVVAVAKSPEERSILGRSLDTIQQAEIYRMSFDDLISSPERIAYGPDFLCYPISLESELDELNLREVKRLPVSIALELDSALKLTDSLLGQKLGVMSVSRSFMSVMHAQMKRIFGDILSYESCLLGNLQKTTDFIADKKVLILPVSVQDFIDSEEVGLIRQAAREGQKHIYVEFSCDEGSMIYVNRTVQDRYRELRSHINDGG